MLIVATALYGYKIHATDGGIGTVKDFLFDDRSWRCRWIVVDTGGWLTGRRVLLHPSAISSIDHDNRSVHVKLTQDQVEKSPPIGEHEPITKATEYSHFDYYSWDPFWGHGMVGIEPGGGLIGASALMQPNGVMLSNGQGPEDGPDPHLRSIDDIENYQVEAIDGDLGRVDNMLMDDATFIVHFLIINTSSWWVGQRVLVSPLAVTGIVAHDRTIALDLTRDAIRNSAPWDPAQIVTADIAAGMSRHYNWPGNRGA